MGDALWQVAFGVVLLTKSAGTTRSLSRSLLLPLLLLTERQWRQCLPLRVVLMTSVLVARWQCGCCWQRERGGVGCSVVGVTWRVCVCEIGPRAVAGPVQLPHHPRQRAVVWYYYLYHNIFGRVDVARDVIV